MKLIPTTRVTNDDPLGHGMEVALTIVVFLALGWLLDRWLGTSPWFIIGFVVFAAVGSFVKLRYTYEARMRQHEEERAQAQQERRTPGQELRS
jgi:ATP synthase protein I